MTRIYRQQIVATAADADELGHVNNAVWVQWIQDVAVAHWQSLADPAHDEAYSWVVVRHEIDYLRSVLPGESVIAQTWIEGPPRGARSTRVMEFIGGDGKRRVRARTEWAMIDKGAGRPVRVPREVVAPFFDGD